MLGGAVVSKVLFVGNGVNRIESNYSWKELLEDLKSMIGKQEIILNGRKPFPMLYEEIYFRAKKNNNVEEETIFEYIVEKMKGLEPNPIHQQIMNLNIEHIITTNYDYALEKVFTKRIEDIKSVSTSQSGSPETIYRITTKNVLMDKHIWHVHGELKNRGTLILGQRMYSKALSKVNSYIDNDFVVSKHKSWIDLMFTEEIHMLGFGLDYSEIDIWLVLNERARYYLKNNKKKNKIYFYMYNPYLENLDFEYILDSFDIKVIKSIEDESAFSFYERVLKDLESSTKQ